MVIRNQNINKDQFINLYEKGKSLRSIAKLLNISYPMTRNRALEWGLIQDSSYNEIDENQLKELYGQGESLKSISNILNIPYYSIRHKFYSLSESLENNKTHEFIEISNKILKMYQEGIPIHTISELLSIPLWSVRNRLRCQGIVFKPRRHEVNDNFFSVLTPTVCYWAGMLAADGWVENDCRIGLELQILDKEHVAKFAKIVNYDGLVYFRTDRPMCSVGFTSDKMAADLRKNFMIVPRKTKILNPPTQLTDELAKHFIRGYNDGDGGFCSTYQRVSIRGQQSVLEWFKTILRRNCDGIGDPKIFWDSGTYKLQFCGAQQFVRIIDWIYDGSNESIRLDRKFTLAQEWKRRMIDD